MSDSIIISDISNGIKYIHVSRKPSIHHCPFDDHKMQSKGIYKHEIIHPILQDTTNIHIIVHQRKWKFPHYRRCINESYPFFERFKQSSNITPLPVLNAMKDLNCTTAPVAEQFFISATQAHDIFTSYVDLPRLPLSVIVSTDEIHLDISHTEKYAFVIMNFMTGEIIDMSSLYSSLILLTYFLINFTSEVILTSLEISPLSLS